MKDPIIEILQYNSQRKYFGTWSPAQASDAYHRSTRSFEPTKTQINTGEISVDDICDTGKSLCAAAQTLKDHGAKDIYVALAHGVFSKDAIERIENSVIKELVVSNTIPKLLSNSLKLLLYIIFAK